MGRQQGLLRRWQNLDDAARETVMLKAFAAMEVEYDYGIGEGFKVAKLFFDTIEGAVSQYERAAMK